MSRRKFTFFASHLRHHESYLTTGIVLTPPPRTGAQKYRAEERTEFIIGRERPVPGKKLAFRSFRLLLPLSLE